MLWVKVFSDNCLEIVQIYQIYGALSVIFRGRIFGANFSTTNTVVTAAMDMELQMQTQSVEKYTIDEALEKTSMIDDQFIIAQSIRNMLIYIPFKNLAS